MKALKKKNKSWLSVHIFYHEKLDFLLIKGVKPFIEKQLAAKLVEKYFFIRYYKNGSHLRLRLYGNNKIIYSKVQKLTENYFKRFLQKYPSGQPENHKPGKDNHHLYPNNSLLFMPYEQEIERYGSEIGIGIAQESFEASSTAILEILTQTGMNAQNHLVSALKMHTAFLSAIFDKKTAINFLHYNIKVWLPKLLLLKKNKELLHPLSEGHIRAGYDFIESQFNSQPGKERILALIHTVWHGVKRKEVFEENWLNNWIASTRTIHRKVSEGFQKKILRLELLFPQYLLSVTEKNKFNIALYDSYVHMTNNRFGILNFDEPLIAFFILKSLTTSFKI